MIAFILDDAASIRTQIAAGPCWRNFPAAAYGRLAIRDMPLCASDRFLSFCRGAGRDGTVYEAVGTARHSFL